MPARDDCVLWTLITPSRQRIVCYVVEGDEGLALTGEPRDEIVLAEMVGNLDTAVRRSDEVRDALLSAGLRQPTE